MDLEKLKAEITEDEGVRKRPYKDTRGIWTGGVGHNLEAHGVPFCDIATWLKTDIPEGLIKEWLGDDVEAALTCCRQVFPAFDGFPEEAQRVLANMAFDLMYELWDWHGLREAAAAHNWDFAASCILHSRFAAEAPGRCRRLANRMRELA